MLLQLRKICRLSYKEFQKKFPDQLRKICENTDFRLARIYGFILNRRFYPYTGEYGSVKTRILAYFMQCNANVEKFRTTFRILT